MKNLLITTFFVLFGAICTLPSSSARAQVPGSIISVGLLGGYQQSNLDGVGSGTYIALRGSFSNLFGEIRHASWGTSDGYVHESGLLAGMDFALWHIMVSGAIGVGTATYQHPAVSGVLPPSIDYKSFIYEAQAIYQIDIVTGMVTIGIGANYVGESNSIAPISGIGAVAMVSVGI